MNEQLGMFVCSRLSLNEIDEDENRKRNSGRDGPGKLFNGWKNADAA